jgi:isopenicillin-N epimerase
VQSPRQCVPLRRWEVQHLIEPLVIRWGWNRDQTSGVWETLEVSAAVGPGGLLDLGGASGRFVEESEWQGTRDIAAYLSVPAAIQFQAENDWPRVRAECHELLREARRRIGDLTGLPPICPDSPKWYTQMAAFPLPPCDAAGLQRRLYDEYRVEVPIVEWGGRQLVRVSVQGYNTKEDVEALLRALESLFPDVKPAV